MQQTNTLNEIKPGDTYCKVYLIIYDWITFYHWIHCHIINWITPCKVIQTKLNRLSVVHLFVPFLIILIWLQDSERWIYKYLLHGECVRLTNPDCSWLKSKWIDSGCCVSTCDAVWKTKWMSSKSSKSHQRLISC